MTDVWDEIPIFENPDDLLEALDETDAPMLRPDRPYDGQSWTDEGERGRELVVGLTMRDISDCIALGFLVACGRAALADSGTATWGDVYDALNSEDLDPRVVAQDVTCRIEKRMGIFPNIPGREHRAPRGAATTRALLTEEQTDD
jgi:hypothetical protein